MESALKRFRRLRGESKPAALTGQPTAEKFDQRGTFFFSEKQLLNLEILKVKLRAEHGMRAKRSELVRYALDSLLATPLDELAANLS